jgi:hypothetical protein
LATNHSTTLVRDEGKIPVIHKNAVYCLEQARDTLRLAKATLGREIRLGRLRVLKRAGKYFILGSWLLEWITAGEVTRPRPSAMAEASGATGNENR